MRAHWYDVESVGLAATAAALQVAFLGRCRWDAGCRNFCSCWGRADRHSLNRRGTHGTRSQWYRGGWCWSGAGGQVDRLGGTVGGRKLEKRAEHDDGARSSSIHAVL